MKIYDIVYFIQGGFMKVLLKRMCAIVIGTSVLLSGCSSKKSTEEAGGDSKIKVVASFYPMYDFTKMIGGDKVDVKTMIPSGVEPHDWEPSPKDIVEIGRSKLFVYNGVGMEPWVDKVKQNIENKDLIYVEASKGVKLLKNSDGDHDDHDKADKHDDHDKADKHDDHDKADKHDDHDKDDKHEHNHGEFDPHVWLNPENAKIEMKNIMEALVKVDPKNKTYYEKNYEENAKKIDKLNDEFKKSLANVKRRDIIVAHQAFGYLCDAYGLKQIPIEGLSPDSEPDAARMAYVTNFAKKNKVKYIFFEELVSPKVAKTIANEVGAKTEVLNPIEGITEKQIKSNANYYTIMEENLKTLVKALN